MPNDGNTSCAPNSNVVVNEQGGLYMRFTNNQNNPIVLWGLYCTTDTSPTAPTNPNNGGDKIPRQAHIDLQGNVQCVNQNGQPVNDLKAGTEFSGKVWVFYQSQEEVDAGYNVLHTASASFVTKVGSTA